MNKLQSFAAVGALFLLAGGLFVNAVPEHARKVAMREGTPQHIPTAVDFAGEPAPLLIADVRERFERELIVNANLDATTLLIIKRANRAFPIIEPILARYGVPDDFKIPRGNRKWTGKRSVAGRCAWNLAIYARNGARTRDGSQRLCRRALSSSKIDRGRVPIFARRQSAFRLVDYGRGLI